MKESNEFIITLMALVSLISFSLWFSGGKPSSVNSYPSDEICNEIIYKLNENCFTKKSKGPTKLCDDLIDTYNKQGCSPKFIRIPEMKGPYRY
jgi:hypothetical protein